MACVNKLQKVQNQSICLLVMSLLKTDNDWDTTEWSNWILSPAKHTATRSRNCKRPEGQTGTIRPTGVGQCRPLPHNEAVDCKAEHENCYVPFTPWSEWANCLTPCDSDMGKQNRQGLL